MGLDTLILVFWMLSLKPTFSLSSVTFIKRFFSSSLLYAIRVVSSAYLRLLIFLSGILKMINEIKKLKKEINEIKKEKNRWTWWDAYELENIKKR